MKSRITIRWSKHFYTYLCKLVKFDCGMHSSSWHPENFCIVHTNFHKIVLLRWVERWMLFFLSFPLFKKQYCIQFAELRGPMLFNIVSALILHFLIQHLILQSNSINYGKMLHSPFIQFLYQQLKNCSWRN